MSGNVKASDMSQFWRLITAEGSDAQHRVHGTWWVSASSEGGINEGTIHVKTVDVTIWNNEAQFGRVFYSGDLTAFVRDGVVDLPKHMIRSNSLAEVEDAWDLLLEVIAAAASAPWRALVEEVEHA